MGHVQNPFILYASSAEIITANQVFDFDANLGITTATGGVSAWTDQSASAQGDLTGLASNRRPDVLTNGNPSGDGDALDFDGVANRLSGLTFTFNQPETIYLVMRWNTWTGSDTAIDGVTALSMALLQSGITPEVKTFSTSGGSVNSDLAIGTWGIYALVFNGTSSSIRVNNNTKTSVSIGTANAGGVVVGSRGDSSSNGDFTIARLLGYDTTAHTDAEQDTNITALNNIYSVF